MNPRTILPRALPLLALAIVARTAIASGPADPPPRHVLSAEEWRADLRTLARELPARHRNAFHQISRAQFDSLVTALDREIPGLEDPAVIVGLARIVAAIGDGHTRLTLPEDPAVAFSQAHSTTPPPKHPGLMFHHLPVRFRLYSDGLFVALADSAHANLCGLRVHSIGKHAAAAALATVRPYVAVDNEMGARLVAPEALGVPEVLTTLGLQRSGAGAVLALEPGPDLRILELGPLPLGAPVRWVSARERDGVPAPLWQQRPESFFWFAPAGDGRTLYAQVNRIADSPNEPLAAFAARLADTLAHGAFDRLALDLRLNAGGSNELNRSLVRALAASPKLARPGHLFVIIGRGTFSAAGMLASQLEYLTPALFVGEPTGARPSGYGDAKKFQLPNSGLTVRASSVAWRDWSVDESRPWIAPDLPAELSSADDRAGIDPALARISAFPADPDLATVVRKALAAGGDRTRLWWTVYRFANDPRTYADTAQVKAAETLLATP